MAMVKDVVLCFASFFKSYYVALLKERSTCKEVEIAKILVAQGCRNCKFLVAHYRQCNILHQSEWLCLAHLRMFPPQNLHVNTGLTFTLVNSTKKGTQEPMPLKGVLYIP